MNWDKSFTRFGLTFIFIGIALILIPTFYRLLPKVDLEGMPWPLLYIYQKDDFYFATSPILILVGIVYFIWMFFRK
jgi:hypothetical protein